MDFGFQIPDVIKKANPFGRSVNGNEQLEYAYPCENYISIVVSNPASKYSLKKFFENTIQKELDKIINNSVEITKKSNLRVFGILQKCCDKLSIGQVPKTYICPQLRGVNSLTVGEDSNPILLISPAAIARLDNKELSFIVGHELGHIAQKNLICHTVKGALDTMSKWSDALGPIVAELIEVPLNRWYRCSEYTADRAGLLCCENLKSALSVFDKSYCDKKYTNSLFDSYNELTCDHPTLSNRISELKKFSQNISLQR